ncbi:MAG: HlyD family efflux transporter periplasmic adaptor subunit [Patescibacteria group bacterium]|jgi:HlyD family secretion protein
MQKIIEFLKKRKMIVGVAIVVLAIAGYFSIKAIKGNAAGVTKYVVAKVEKGTLITSVTGSGQVSASDQVDIKPTSASEVTSVSVKKGQEVKTGDFLVQLDSQDSASAVADAEVNLENAKLELEKANQPSDELSILQAENSLEQAKQNRENASSDLTKSYTDGIGSANKVFLDLTEAMQAMNQNNLLNFNYYYDVTKSYDSGKALYYKNTAQNSYQTALKLYNETLSDLGTTSRSSSAEEMETLINNSYSASVKIAESLKNYINLIQFYKNILSSHNVSIDSAVDRQLTTFSSDVTKINNGISELSLAKQKLQSSKNAIINADSQVLEKQAALDKAKEPVDEIEIKTKQNNIKQRENALIDAQKKLADCNVKAPFDGIVATIDAKVGDSVSQNASFITLITKDRIADISLNEVDSVKVKADQKVTLTFDAISDLTLTGKIAEIDSIATTTQNVASYNAKIVFDTQDERIKPGMSVSASIITDSKADVLLVPVSAVKNSLYVEMPDEDIAPNATSQNSGIILKKELIQQQITIGLSNDSYSEITDGLKEGDIIITRTIAPTTTKATTTTSGNSLFQMGGNQKNMGGNNLRSSQMQRD